MRWPWWHTRLRLEVLIQVVNQLRVEQKENKMAILDALEAVKDAVLAEDAKVEAENVKVEAELKQLSTLLAAAVAANDPVRIQAVIDALAAGNTSLDASNAALDAEATADAPPAT
jgi:hypothetical protein